MWEKENNYHHLILSELVKEVKKTEVHQTRKVQTANTHPPEFIWYGRNFFLTRISTCSCWARKACTPACNPVFIVSYKDVSLFPEVLKLSVIGWFRKVKTESINTVSGASAQALHNLPGTYSAAGCCCRLWKVREPTLVQDRSSEPDRSELQGLWGC